jgi:hypothetical protein
MGSREVKFQSLVRDVRGRARAIPHHVDGLGPNSCSRPWPFFCLKPTVRRTCAI